MWTFFKKLKSLISEHIENLTEPASPTALPLKFIRSRKGIARQLLNSKESGKVVGITCAAFGEGMFLTCVDDMFTVGREEVIVFKPYDLHGRLLKRDHVAMTEIISVIPFEMSYTHPIVDKQQASTSLALQAK